ncbi:MAG TPA: QacE family quaternary ammonium compound efflux SMR transporter [Bacillus bacterium]|uniref:Multidrug SMR transporter n=1 Tax=Siminovitchia fordii TaxID=254759 RepID=A0ABQ4KCI3_9BACI|nr:multidrug efflux SMR transporter [Siminovitchia fordii]GIN22757.1 multidrug SMR transporter [Siminovitchia fordii]HBZ09698.1 QacE family quaternary ammonium compound efflux SMR transporter [Bacillus sp. (in: firmicutes)]
MAWTYVLFAAIVEVFWVIGLRYSETLPEWLGTTVAIILSFFFIIKACEKLPSGTVYAVFTGSGAAVIVLIDFLFFGADFSLSKVFFIALIIVGVVGIKITTDGQVESKTNTPSAEGK